MAFDELFQPLQIGTTEIRCRIVSTSQQTTMVHNHLPTDEFVAYQQARARGGVGLIIIGGRGGVTLRAPSPRTRLADTSRTWSAATGVLLEAVHAHSAKLFVSFFMAVAG